MNRGSSSCVCAANGRESVGCCDCDGARRVDPDEIDEIDGMMRGSRGWPVRPGAECGGRCGRHRVVNRDRRLLRSKPSQIRRLLQSRARSFLFGVLFSFLSSLGVFLSGGIRLPISPMNSSFAEEIFSYRRICWQTRPHSGLWNNALHVAWL